MPSLLSVNAGVLRPVGTAASSGIDKRPVRGAVAVAAPAGRGGSGLAGDHVGDRRNHGGGDQALYAYAHEDLQEWAALLGRELPPGSFGENLTTLGLDVDGALVGERWRIGEKVVVQVTTPRIPCRTFAEWLGERGWVRRFSEARRPGAYLRVLVPGEIRAGDDVVVEHRPAHEVSVATAFAAFTGERELLPLLAGLPELPEADRALARRRLAADEGPSGRAGSGDGLA